MDKTLAMALRIIGTGALALLFFAAPAISSDLLPRPPGLEPEIEFWTRVFGEIPSTEALVHDSRYLSIVYEVVQIPAGASPSTRRRVADKARAKYRKVLNELADGSRTSLSAEKRRILALWPADVSNDELQEAARRIRFQQGLADRFEEGLVRSGAWKPYIRDNLQTAQVPVELAALPHVESSFNPVARSHVGAAGLWQFTRTTGRRFMQIDHVVDERRDPFMSSDAAAQLLAYNYSILRSWPLAITAYNHGVAGMRRATKKLGTDDIEVIIRRYNGRTFGFASRNFYVAFLAALDVDTRAPEFFGPVMPDAPRGDLIVEMPDYFSINTLQVAFGLPMSALQDYNPALMPSVWDGTKYVPKGFLLRLPQDAGPASQVQRSDHTLRLASIPTDFRFHQQTPDLYHKIQTGESLSVIAARYKTSVSELVALNGLRSRHRIRAGQTLRLPYRGQNIGSSAETYVVRNGDTIGTIAARSGVRESDIVALNSLKNKNEIYAGQMLRLRGGTVTTKTAVPVPVQVAAAQTAAPDLQPEETTVPEPIVTVVEPAVAEAPMEEPLAEQDSIATIATLLDEAIENQEQEGSAAVDERATVQEVLLADPSDYVVADNGTIEIQAAETLGHYADWLDVKTQRLRDLNEYSFRQPLVIGRRLKLDFENVDPDTFMSRRIAYHRELQEAFFVRYRITETTAHDLQQGESVWYLTRRRYKVPVWLLRQYNPDLDLGRVRPGMQVVFPQIEPIELESANRNALADAS